MTPLTEDDLELEADLVRLFDADEVNEWFDGRLSEAEAMELADGARMRPLSEE